MSESTRRRLAAAQVDCVTGDVEANLSTCLAAIEEARAQEVDLIVFPELALTGSELEGRILDVARTLQSPELLKLAEASKGLTAVVGFVEEGDDARFYNSVACFEDGRVVHVHRKLYLVTYGSLNEGRLFAAGSRVDALDTGVGRVGALICEDIWHPTLPYLVTLDGAQVLATSAASPEGLVAESASSRELWSALLRTHAITCGCFHVFSNRAGREGSLDFWGGSMIWGPGGELLASADSNDPALVVAEVDLEAVRRQRSSTPFLRDERVELTLRELERIGGRRLRSRAGEDPEDPDSP